MANASWQLGEKLAELGIGFYYSGSHSTKSQNPEAVTIVANGWRVKAIDSGAEAKLFEIQGIEEQSAFCGSYDDFIAFLNAHS